MTNNTTAPAAQFSQKEAVYVAYTTALSDRGIEFTTPGSLSPEVLSAVRKDMRENIASGIVDGSISCEKEDYRSDLAKASTYASGLISNWFKKDTRLTGGVKYEAQSTRGPVTRDEKLKALKNAHKAATAANDMELLTKLEAAISKRQAEVDAERQASKAAKAPSVDDAVAKLAELGIEL